jgi:hypothetical protein
MTAPPEPLTKGSRVVDLVKMVRNQREAFSAVLSPETRAFTETRVLVGSWYPETYLRDLLIAADHVLGTGDLALCEQLGHFSARHDLGGVYKSLLHTEDPWTTLTSLPAVWGLMHNTGRVELEPAAGGALVAVRGYALPNAPMCALLRGWLKEATVLSGGLSVAVVEETCRLRAQEACLYRVSWSRTGE